MDARGAFDGLDLDKDLVLDEEIGAESLVEDDVAVADRNGNLGLDDELTLSEFVGQRGLVDGLEEPRSELGMHGEGCVHDLRSDLVLGHERGSLRLRVFARETEIFSFATTDSGGRSKRRRGGEARGGSARAVAVAYDVTLGRRSGAALAGQVAPLFARTYDASIAQCSQSMWPSSSSVARSARQMRPHVPSPAQR